MSSSNGTQEETSASIKSLPKSQKTNTTLIYPSPPCSPPQTKSNSSETRREFEDELRSSRTVCSELFTPTSSHQNTSKATPKEKKPLEDKSQASASALKAMLVLNDLRCGCHTQKKKPCTKETREGNKDQINSQLKSMITLTRSSPELEAELDKLVMLVHCYQHDCGDPKDFRIDAWTTVFPDDDTAPAVSVEKQIKRALGRFSTQCIGETAQGKRCKQRIRGQKVQNCRKPIDEIMKSEVYFDDVFLDGLLKVLETNMYCHIHIVKRPLENVILWKSSIMEIRKQAKSASV